LSKAIVAVIRRRLRIKYAASLLGGGLEYRMIIRRGLINITPLVSPRLEVYRITALASIVSS